MRLLLDECCPRVFAEALRRAKHDVRYAAETDKQASDVELLVVAASEDRVIVTEDFDFGDLLIRDRMTAPGVIIVNLPKLQPETRAARLASALQTGAPTPFGAITIIEAHRIRQRRLKRP